MTVASFYAMLVGLSGVVIGVLIALPFAAFRWRSRVSAARRMHMTDLGDAVKQQGVSSAAFKLWAFHRLHRIPVEPGAPHPDDKRTP